MSRTVLEVLEATARAHAERPAMAVKRGGAWRYTSWREYRDAVRRAGRGLLALGAGPGRGVVIMGFNRPEWFVANVGAMAAGALPAGIYTTSTPEQCRYIADHAEAAVALVEKRQYLDIFLGLRDRLPGLGAIVVMEAADAQGEGVLSFDELLARGDAVAEARLEERTAGLRPEDVCSLIYTSGTTGPPKAVMLTHANVTWVAERVREFTGTGPEDRFLSYLALSHIAEQVVSHHTPMAGGGCTYFAESLEALGENLREVRPTMFFGVPRVWEKMQAAMQAAGAQSPAWRRRLVGWARRVGLAAGHAEQEGRPRPRAHPIARALVFSKVRRRLGLDCAQLCAVSAAPIAVETLEFFLSLGIPIMEVYGMSELTGPATASVPGRYRTGWAGFALPGTELRLGEDAEILVRGPHVFKGYYKDDAATAETLDADGWVHTGDVGEMGPDGFMRVTDRKKELIITSGGKNVAPAGIEGRLRQIPAVSQAAVIGDRRPYLVALLTLDPARWPAEAVAAGSPATSAHEACACPRFRSHVERQVQAVNQGLAGYEQVRRFKLLPDEFSIPGGELTPTLKLKRRVLHQNYAAQIAELYQP
jgi:long-subunit acyl-CoA synthetase (AMP-forming)